MKTNKKDMIIYCPSGAFDCPYYKKNGVCTIEDPLSECDDFGSYYETYEDYNDEIGDQ